MQDTPLIKPLQLGNKLFPLNLIQGPLAGVSCAPFRALTWKYGQPAFSCTEMISVNTLIHQPKLSHRRFVDKDANEGPVCFQLAGNDPIQLAEAVKRANDYGADLIDLNCGCPVNKIRKKGSGSRLLSQGSKLYQLITAMKNNTNVPVSIKIRVEGGSKDAFHQDIANVVNDAGADFLVVHGRHWTEHYETPCHYEDIQFFVQECKIPVIGNGDIACAASLKKMFTTGCAGAMIGRAGVGQPWLIKQLITELNQETFTPPTKHEIGKIMIEHTSKLALLLNSEKFAVLQARKFSKYYARNFDNKIDFCNAINQCINLTTFIDIVNLHTQ